MAPNKPTILFLASWYPVPNNKSHGIFIRNHAIALSEFCQVIVVYAHSSLHIESTLLSVNAVNENLEEWIVNYKKTTIKLPLISALFKLRHFKKAYKLLANKLSDKKVNIKAIQVNVAFPAAIALSVFKEYKHLPYTVLEHWTGYLPTDGSYKGFLLKYYTQRLIAGASKIFYVSTAQKNTMLQHGLKGNYEFIYNVTDTSVFKISETAKPLKPMLLHVSALDNDQKNINGIVNVIQKLQKNNFDFDFTFIGGSQSLVKHFEDRSKAMHLKNVVFTGVKSASEIATYMQQSSALVLFSNYENMPVVVLESLACGLPVISTKVGELELMIQPGFGQLIDIGDEKELENVLTALLEGELQFNSRAMSDYVLSHAAYRVVGEQLYRYYSSLLAS